MQKGIKTPKQLLFYYLIAFVLGTIIELIVMYVDQNSLSLKGYIDSAHVLMFVLMLQMSNNYLRNIHLTHSEKEFKLKRKQMVILTWVFIVGLAVSFQVVGFLVMRTTLNWSKSLMMGVIWSVMFPVFLLLFSEYTPGKKRVSEDN